MSDASRHCELGESLARFQLLSIDLPPTDTAQSPALPCPPCSSPTAVMGSPVTANVGWSRPHGSPVTPTPFGRTRKGSPASSTSASPVPCSICLSPVGRGSLLASPIQKEMRARFRTPCCGQLFHRDCMQRHKEQCASGGMRCCPLCRSAEPTGLTPQHRHAPGGGSSEMRRRVAAARAAVQRSLERNAAAARAAAAPALASSTSSVFFTAPAATDNVDTSLPVVRHQSRSTSVGSDIFDFELDGTE